MTEYNLTPKTRPVPVSKLRVGDIIVQTWEHPVRLTKATFPKGVFTLRGKYIWQEPKEMDWPIGRFPPFSSFERAVR